MQTIQSKKEKIKISKLHYSHKNNFENRRLFKIKYLIKIKVINKNLSSPEFLTYFLNRFNLV